MADLSTTVYNERVKLTATWINGMAVAFFAVGGLAPLFTMLYGDRPASLQLILSSMSCILAAPALHYWSRFSLKGMKE
jgi:Na+/melibiose symporter-like transporter